MKAVNQLGKAVMTLRKKLPVSMLPYGYSLLFNSMVKFAGTAGVKINVLEFNKSEVYLKNRFRIQNHIGGVHACGMALASETATGIIVGLNVPDTHLPLCKSMKIDFVRRAKGSLTAVATLTDEQVEQIRTTDKGEVLVDVKVTDEDGNEPIKAEMLWAWVPKKK